MNLKIKILISLLVIVEIIFCFTPVGSIPIGPIVATLSMLPVIIASLTFGKNIGAMFGFLFAMFSLIYWTFVLPSYPTSFLFTPFSEFAGYKGNVGSLIICFVPRIIGGILPAIIKNKSNDIVATIVGSFANTILVLLFIFIFFKNQYATIMGKTIFYLIGFTILSNGIPECVIAVIVCPFISKILRKY